MLLKPFEDEASEAREVEVLPPSRVPSGIMSVLADVGLAENETEPDDAKHIQEILKENGAGVQDAARQLGLLLKTADTDNVKLSAIRTVLEVNEIIKRKDDTAVQAPQINIIINGTGNKTLINMLVPTP